MSVIVMALLKRAKIPCFVNAVVVIAVLAAAFAMLGAGGLSARAGQADQPAAEKQADQPAAEMLQDGLDALSDSQADLAVQLFEQLLQSYPGTPESTRAARELAALGIAPRQPPLAMESSPAALENAPAAPEAASGLVRRTPESETALRLTFAKDAGDRVFFAENSAVIGGRARALIEAQARWLALRTDIKVTVIGRADDGGPIEAARELSNMRAVAVRDRLVAGGVAMARITIDARGVRDPVATCRSSLCQAQNRHAETAITFAGSSSVPADLTVDGERGRVQGAFGSRARGAAIGGGVASEVSVSR